MKAGSLIWVYNRNKLLSGTCLVQTGLVVLVEGNG